MKKLILLTFFLTLTIPYALAENAIWIHQKDNIALGTALSSTESITLSNNGNTINFNHKNNSGTNSFDYTAIEKVTIDDNKDIVIINYNGTDASIINPYAFSGVTVTKNGANISINSSCSEEIKYEISGTAPNGSLTISSLSPFTLSLNGAKISNSSFSAINVTSNVLCNIELKENTTSTLSDGDEGANGCIYSIGTLRFIGNGTLNISANTKHAIASKQSIEIESGTINILSSTSDGIHSSTCFVMNGGKVSAKSINGDVIDGDTGTVEINDGTLDLEISVEDKKAIKSDDKIVINGGIININMPANQGKAIRTKSDLAINGGDIKVNASGNVIVTANDPSYCSIIKTNGVFTMTNGSLIANHSGIAGKGISADGNIEISGGNISIEVSGASGTYTNTSGELDSYSPTCISSDADINITGGSILLTIKSNQAKGIKSNGNTTVSGGNISGILSGNAVAIKDNPSYCSLIKADGDFTLNDGTIYASHSGIGGKGISADGTATFNGGIVDITTTGKSDSFTTSTGYDSFKSTCITADNGINIKNGKIRTISATNYAIGSNTKIAISGGTTIASGVSNNNTTDISKLVSITGGTIVNHSGNMPNITISQCNVPTIKYTNPISAGTLITITDSSNKHIMSFKAPQAMSQGCYITHPSLILGNSYKVYSGGNVTDGTSINEIMVSGNYSAGTLIKTITLSSLLTSL